MKQIQLVIILLVCVTSSLSQSNSDCSNVMDVMFVVDGSASVNFITYDQIITKIKDSLDLLDIGVNMTRVGMVRFSGSQQIKEIPLSSDINFLKTECETLREHPDTTTDTDKALARAIAQLRSSRRDAVIPQVIVIVTDGYGNYEDLTMYQVQVAENDKIRMITVGIRDKLENKNMATDEARDMFVLSEWPKVIVRLNEVAALYCPTPDCAQGVNMVFVLDGSASVFYTNFYLTVQSIKNSSAAFWNMYPKSSIGLVVFSTSIHDVVPITADKAQFLNRLDNIEYPDAGTFTWLGIREGTSQLAKASSEMPKVMILITDGNPENQTATIETANFAKAQNITIYGIGVGRVDPAKLREIISQQAGDIMLAENFDELSAKLTSYISDLCLTTTVTVTKEPPPNLITPTPFSSVCNRALDVTFVVDASSGVGSSNLRLVTSAVQAASLYFLNGADSRVKILTFSSEVTSNSGPLSNATSLQNAINAIPFVSGTRATHKALTQVSQDLESDLRVGERTGVPDAVVIILAGASDFPAESAVIANSLIAPMAAKVFSLGISNAVTDTELVALTFNVASRWMKAANYSYLPPALSTLAQTVCTQA